MVYIITKNGSLHAAFYNEQTAQRSFENLTKAQLRKNRWELLEVETSEIEFSGDWKGGEHGRA